MDIYMKTLLFYLSLDDREKKQFVNLIGGNSYNTLISRADTSSLNDWIGIKRNRDYHDSDSINYNKYDKDVDYDMAIMQLVRHIARMSNSNISLARSIEKIIGKNVSRPEKRSKYELQGMLLGALIEAPKETLLSIRSDLLRQISNSKVSQTSQTNLDKWFSIIMGAKR